MPPSVLRRAQFIGNHQAPAVDMGPLVSEVCQKRGILMRALAHPILFEGIEESNPSGDAELRALRNRYRQARELSSEESRSGGGMLGEGLFGTYGCVPVGPTNLVRLLKNGEAVLLFPGGAR